MTTTQTLASRIKIMENDDIHLAAMPVERCTEDGSTVEGDIRIGYIDDDYDIIILEEYEHIVDTDMVLEAAAQILADSSNRNAISLAEFCHEPHSVVTAYCLVTGASNWDEEEFQRLMVDHED